MPSKKFFSFQKVLAALILAFSVSFAHADRDVMKAPTRTWNPVVNQDYIVRFSTTIPADTAVQLLSTHTVDTSAWASGITHSTEPSNTAGGAAYVFFKVQGSSSKVWFDFNPASLSTSTLQSPSIENNGYYPPTDMPLSYQDSLWVQSDATATLTGYIIFNRSWNR